MTKIKNFALKIKGGGKEGDTWKVLRSCHSPKIWNVHLEPLRSHFSKIAHKIAK